MATPISPDIVRELAHDYLPAYLSNGVVGLRVREVPLIGGTAVVGGLAGAHPEEGIECTPYVPYPLGGDVRLGGVSLSRAPWRAQFIEQAYDFSCGELTSRFVLHGDGVDALIESVTFCSRSLPSLALQELRIELTADCDVTLSATVDPQAIPGRWLDRTTLPSDLVDSAMHWEPYGGLAQVGIALTTRLSGAGADRRVDEGHERPLRTDYAFKGVRGVVYRLTQIASLVPSATNPRACDEAIRRASAGRRRGFDQLRRENAALWRELWRGRVSLVGADRRWQGLADAAFFYLNSSVHSSSLASTHIFGLSQWPDYHYYYGHVMWDIETFALPVVLLSQPQAARAMLDYRTRSMFAANQNAALHGYRGLMFPWEASPGSGAEASPVSASGADYEHHVSLGVAHAFAQYGYATRDADYLQRQAWPVVRGVAEWLQSRVEKTARGYELRRTMGVAERQEPIDNSAYVNMAATIVLREAVDIARRVGHEAPAAWSRIADELVVPRGPEPDVIAAHDDYDPSEEKGATPDPLAGLFPWGYEVEPHVEAATLRFYLDRADDYIGSPMLSALYGAWACRLGERDLAARLFDDGYAKFVSERFRNTHEYREDRFPEHPAAGPFIANLAGFLQACLYGIAGLRIGRQGVEASTSGRLVLPAGWDAIEVEQLRLGDDTAALTARHGDLTARLVPDTGATTPLAAVVGDAP